jgi:hypothetical protein
MSLGNSPKQNNSIGLMGTVPLTCPGRSNNIIEKSHGNQFLDLLKLDVEPPPGKAFA